MRCMYHGLKFDATGKCVQIPGQDNIPPKLGVRSYPVVERDHLVWIWMGDPAKADPAKILDFPYLRDAGLARASRLPALRRQLPADRRQPRGLRAPRLRAREDAGRLGGVRLQVQADRDRAPGRRLSRRALAHERAAAAVPQEGDARRRRRSTGATSRRMHVPGIFFMETLFSPAGSGAEKGNLAGAKQYRNCQFFTPETRAHARTSSGTTCTTTTSTIRTSRCRSTTAWSRASTRTRRSSRRSRRRWTPIPHSR